MSTLLQPPLQNKPDAIKLWVKKNLPESQGKHLELAAATYEEALMLTARSLPAPVSLRELQHFLQRSATLPDTASKAKTQILQGVNAQLERQGLGLRWTYKPTGIAIEQTQLIVHGRKGGLDFSAMRTVHGKPKLPSGSLPFQCGETTSFNASGTGLTSLKGAPINVVGDCDVRWNRLVSLRGLPFQFGILLAVDNPMLTMLDAAIHLAPLGADALGSLDDTATRARTLGTGLGAIQQAVRVQRWAPDEPSSRPPGIGNTDAQMRTLVANGANLSGNDSAGSILSQKGIPKLETFWPLAERWVLILDAIFKRPENSNPEQWRANSLKLLEILQMHVTGPQKTTEAPKDAATAGHRAAKTEEEPAMTAPRFTNR